MTSTTEAARLHGWRLFSLLALLVLIAAALALWSQPQWVEALRSSIRVTARTSFALFLATFLASSLAALVPSDFTRGLLRERRFLGLAFAFSHAVHAVLIILYVKFFPETFWHGRSAAANIPGSVGYVFIFLLAITSFPYAMKLLGTRLWKGLHSTGTWVIAGVFFLSFYKRLPMGSWYPLGFGLIFSAIAFKLVAKLAVRLRRSTRTALPNI
ncbi:DMSO/TMAO reductase YedYZ heme-binding membrane subunit [Pseudomonas nitritireducens]|uniref:DMSO/TMAO reductase YedYZ heme-binding membrane subunit n=1 Tax=Pseudomonas nitroreducens TaxID=46680 RepID=A0A7W7KGS1_PSENT|nr:ferric reductase-like transmembrane domain-containing protein [Pseudomonas nitritireducens]MBB4862572.1 DMSO/TMAO reductase YedYZ heme-binding membrane subunit [Pseudomonas nitritireducens]